MGRLAAVRLFRNNVGAYEDRYGNWVTYGLGTGTSDLVGWRTVTVTPDMVGRRIAVFTAIETKKPGGRTAKKRLEDQAAFLNIVNGMGGLAGFANSVETAREILNRPAGLVLQFP